MNYILITPKVRTDLNGKLLDLNNELNMSLSLKAFLQHSFNTSSRGIIYNKISDDPLRIKIWSAKMNLLLEELDERKGFKTLSLKENTYERFNSMLRYCKVLKGQWDFELISSDVSSLGDYDYLREEESHNEKNIEFDKYHKYWLNYDLITKKKEEKSKKQQELSVTKYSDLAINFDKQEVTVYLKEREYDFKITDRVRLSLNLPNEKYDKGFNVSGEIIDIKSNFSVVVISVKNGDILNKLHNNKELIKGYIYLDDAGTMVMLNRQKGALKRLFNRDTANKRLKDFIPNIKNISTYNINSVESPWDESKSNLNSFQKKAVKGALSCNDIFLIQGPPGTGKTTVICEIIKELVNRNQNVLLSSQSHLAVDNVLQRIGDKDKVRAIRIGDEEKIELGCDKYILNNRVVYIQEKLKSNLIAFEDKKTEMLKELNEIETVSKSYELVKDEIKLLRNLVDNYSNYTNSSNKLKCNIEDNDIKIKQLREEVLKFDIPIVNNEEIFNEIIAALDEYDQNEDIETLSLKLERIKISEQDLEKIENFDVIVSILEVKISEHKELLDSREDLIKRVKEYEEQFSTTKGQIFSLSDQYDYSTSIGVKNAIWDKIEELKCNLVEIKDQYRECDKKIRNIDFRLDNILSEINQCKNEAQVYKQAMEDILLNNVGICNSKKELLDIAKLKKYLSLKINNNKVWGLLKYLNTYKEIQVINSELNNTIQLNNELESSLQKELKIKQKIEEKINEYSKNENIKYILESENLDILEVNNALVSKLDQLGENFKKLQYKVELIEKTNELRNDFMNDLQVYQKSFEDMYVGVSNVICATCSGIASTNNNSFATREFDYVIIDEAAKCFSSELLIPMIKGKKIILVGDHKQISPIIEKDILLEMEKESVVDNDEKELYYNTSLFGIIFEDADISIKTTLSKQYRMNSDISMFISKQFYKNELKDGENIINLNYGIGNMDRGLYWVDSGDINKARESVDGTSYYNKKETEVIIKCLKWIDKKASSKKEIGIISPYKSQKNYLLKEMSNIELKNIEVEINTIDTFQGREKDIIIMNLVRNNKNGEFGHVSGDSRVNVALSRAKELCLVIGNEEFISNNKSRARSLYNLLKYTKENNMRLSENNFEIQI